MNFVFYVVGACVLISAFITGNAAESSIHQIYAQLQGLTAVIIIGFGHVFTCINNKNEIKKDLPSEEERKAFERKQLESLHKAE